jgi:hypothetical protein
LKKAYQPEKDDQNNPDDNGYRFFYGKLNNIHLIKSKIKNEKIRKYVNNEF